MGVCGCGELELFSSFIEKLKKVLFFFFFAGIVHFCVYLQRVLFVVFLSGEFNTFSSVRVYPRTFVACEIGWGFSVRVGVFSTAE